MASELNCHKCPHQGTSSCLDCKKGYMDYSKRLYILEGYDAPQPDTSGSEPCTDLPEEVEDKFRKFLFDMFDLDFSELLLLKSIMNGLSLQEHARSVEKFANDNQTCSRFKVFQQRKRLLHKLGETFAPALLTMGQKRPLKKESK